MTKFLSGGMTAAAMSALAGALLISTPIPAGAQNASIEEITVTARKREENLKDVPVSISVVNSDLIDAAGIANQQDLFDMTPGLVYDDGNNFGDRNAGAPGIRGIQSLEIASTRQKATSFLDGMPMNGQGGSLQFVDVERVEVYRGPQSAAFGRATFAGAVNYVSKDPTNDFHGFLSVNASDQERRQYQGGISGPLGDKVGFRLDANYEEVRGNPDWVSTDGYDLGNTETTYISAKLKFNPTDRIEAELRFMHLETEDGNGATYFITDPSCLNFAYTDPQGRAQNYLTGSFNCDTSIPDGGIQRNHDTAATFAPDDPDYNLALSYAVLDPTVMLDRDRIQGSIDFDIGEGVLQVLAYHSDDMAQRWQDADRSNTALTIAMGMVGMNSNTMADPNEIEESYAEVRWVSPGDQKLQYVFGASYYDYTFLTNIFAQYAGIVLGLEDELGPINPLQIFSEDATNTGVFVNLTYAATDKTTLSFEGRYQSDDINNFNNVTGDSFNNKTTSFQPRLAINHTFSDQVSIYGQYSTGNNPAGVNVNFTNPQAIESIAIANTGNEFGPAVITYDHESFLTFDEEELTNFEVGVKASLADNKVNLAAAVYYMEWEDMVQPYNLNWDGDWNDNGMGGSLYIPPFTMSRSFINLGSADFIGVEGEVNWRASNNFSVRATFALQKAEYTDFCSLWAVGTLGMTPDLFAADGDTPADCVIVDGNTPVRQPDLNFTISPSYHGELGNSGWGYNARLDWRRSGSNYMDDANIMKMPDTDILNLSLSFSNEMFDIRVYGNNLTDDDTPSAIGYAADWNQAVNGSIDNLYILGRRPREVGVRLQVDF
jgi:iron complex outermembrane receptor protein